MKKKSFNLFNGKKKKGSEQQQKKQTGVITVKRKSEIFGSIQKSKFFFFG